MLHVLVVALSALLLVLVFVAAIVMAVSTFRSWRRDRYLRSDEHWKEVEAAAAERHRPWLDKMEKSKYLLTGEDWTSPAGKEEFVREVFGPGVPQYLWYMTNGSALTDMEVAVICNIFWEEGQHGFGDLEFHGAKLRIRSAEAFMPEIALPGRAEPFPLCQVGYTYSGGVETGCVNFITLKPELEKAQ